MLSEEEILKLNYKKITISCPKCKKEKTLNVPTKIVDQSEHLTTISIPVDFVCNHSFQVFIDKDLIVRGYQNADFEISKIEFYEYQPKIKEDLITYKVSELINKMINIIRVSLTNKQISGAAIFNASGKSLYSSLPENLFIIISNQLEIQKKDIYQEIKNIFLIFNNEQKILSEIIHIQDYKLILVLYFSSNISINDGNSYLNRMKEQILDINDINRQKKKAKKEPSPFWIFSTISKEDFLNNNDSVYIDSLGYKVSKSVILNLTEIIQKSSNNPFKGKIYFTEKYVKLMEGLALTLKDAALFLNKLNKIS